MTRTLLPLLVLPLRTTRRILTIGHPWLLRCGVGTTHSIAESQGFLKGQFADPFSPKVQSFKNDEESLTVRNKTHLGDYLWISRRYPGGNRRNGSEELKKSIGLPAVACPKSAWSVARFPQKGVTEVFFGAKPALVCDLFNLHVGFCEQFPSSLNLNS